MAASPTDESTVGSDPAIAWLQQKAKGFSQDADDLRASTDRAAKALAALASAGLTAVGIDKIGAVYPWPDDGWFEAAVLVLFAGFLLMAGCAAWLVVRLWKANRPLAIGTNLAGLDEKVIDDDDHKRIEWIYKDAMSHAPFTHGPNEPIEDHERRADQLEQEALHTPDSPVSQRRLAQVARMRAEIDKAEERAKLVVVRRRMNRALAGRWTVLPAILFVVGLVGFAVAADRLENTPKTACTSVTVETDGQPTKVTRTCGPPAK